MPGHRAPYLKSRGERREARGEKSNKSFSNSNFTFVELTLVEAKVRKKEEESKFLAFFWRLLVTTPAVERPGTQPITPPTESAGTMAPYQ